jgi:hypothetical protein
MGLPDGREEGRLARMSKPSRRLRQMPPRPSSGGFPVWAVVLLVAAGAGLAFVAGRGQQPAAPPSVAAVAPAAPRRLDAVGIPPAHASKPSAGPTVPLVEGAIECEQCSGGRRVLCPDCRAGFHPMAEAGCPPFAVCRMCDGIPVKKTSPTLGGLRKFLLALSPGDPAWANNHRMILNDPQLVACWQRGDLEAVIAQVRVCIKRLEADIERAIQRDIDAEDGR